MMEFVHRGDACMVSFAFIHSAILLFRRDAGYINERLEFPLSTNETPSTRRTRQ